MSALDRIEAFTPREPDQATLMQYEKSAQSTSLLGKIMLALQENPKQRDDMLKQHLAGVQERSQVRRIVTSLPVRDYEGDGTKLSHKHSYLKTKQTLEAKPRHGSLSHILKEYGA